MRKLLVIGALLAAAAICPAVTAAAESGAGTADTAAVKGIVKQAVRMLEGGRHQEAYSFLQTYYVQFPGDNDINFLLGQAAGMIGKYPEAITLYRNMLAKTADLPRVRLELGRALAANGQHGEAREEFNKVLASSPPPAVAEHVKRFLAQLDTQKNVNIKVSAGYMYDSNVNAGPENTVVSGSGWVYDQVRKSDYGITTALQADFLHSVSQVSAWQSGVQYNRTDYASTSKQSWNEINLYTGPLWRSGAMTYSLPFSYKRTEVGGSSFSKSLGVTPQIQKSLSGNRELVLSFSHQHRTFITNGSRDGDARVLTMGERFNLNADKSRFVEIGAAVGQEVAKDSSYSNTNLNVYTTYYTPLASSLSLLLRPGITWYKYKADDVWTTLPGMTGAKRNDTQYGLMVNLIQTDGSWNYIFGYNYTHNSSNIDIYTYNRTMVSWQATTYF